MQHSAGGWENAFHCQQLCFSCTWTCIIFWIVDFILVSLFEKIKLICLARSLAAMLLGIKCTCHCVWQLGCHFGWQQQLLPLCLAEIYWCHFPGKMKPICQTICSSTCGALLAVACFISWHVI